MVKFISLLSWAATALATCAYGTTFYSHKHNITISVFGYTDLNGSLNWYSPNKTANELCAKSHRQSPINLNYSLPILPDKDVSLSFLPFLII